MSARGYHGSLGLVLPLRRTLAALAACTAALAIPLSSSLVSACSTDDSPRLSSRGEACQVTADCSGTLACQPLTGGGGVCVTAQFNVAPSGKECAVVECEVASDCCSQSDVANCGELFEECFADAGTASTAACIEAAGECGCGSQTACENGTCVSHCSADTDCADADNTRRCSGGNCVQCTADTDCSGGQLCNAGTCQDPCSGDGDCSGFDRCVAGRCVASGCQTDRECIASTRNVDAKCTTSGTCFVPCETDLECGDPTSYQFYSCIDNACTYVGCVSDKDCRLFLLGPSDASTLTASEHIVCRDPGLVGTTVGP